MTERETEQNHTCRLVRPDQAATGKQALPYLPGISAESVGSRAINMQLVTIPPGGKARAHLHANHETALYVLRGEAGMWYGGALEHHLTAGPGDFMYIPANVPHQPYNRRDTHECVAVIARTDPNEQESVVLLPDLDPLHGS